MSKLGSRPNAFEKTLKMRSKHIHRHTLQAQYVKGVDELPAWKFSRSSRGSEPDPICHAREASADHAISHCAWPTQHMLPPADPADMWCAKQIDGVLDKAMVQAGSLAAASWNEQVAQIVKETLDFMGETCCVPFRMVKESPELDVLIGALCHHGSLDQ